MADPTKLSETVQQVVERLDSPEHAARLQGATADRLRRAVENRASEQREKTERLWTERGSRYEKCTFRNFVVTIPAQQKVVDTLQKFGEDICQEIDAGTNVLLIGPHGTGKDHLLAALMHMALAAGRTIKWTSGARLFASIRDDIERHAEELAAIREYTYPDVLVLSDPIWEGEPLTRGQRIKLGEIVDNRYYNERAIWTTINTRDGAEAADKMGAALVDRLRDGAVSLVCDWPTYRKSREL